MTTIETTDDAVVSNGEASALDESATVIKGQYRIDEKLGEGGPSVVFRGLDLLMQIPIAIKKLKRSSGEGLNDATRFLREARTQAKLVHENIVSIRSILEEDGEHYIVMELIEGQPLENLIKGGTSIPRLPIVDVVDFGAQTLRGLGHAHGKGVYHRDIKPANIMITNEGIAKLADFGIAREIHDQRLTQTGAIIGTPAYMSPEQIRAMEVDHRTDIYSLGVTLYEAISGHTTFENPDFQRPDLFEMLRRHTMQEPLPLVSLGIDLPPALDAAILKSLAKTPDERFSDCHAFRVALLQSVDREPIELEGRLGISVSATPGTSAVGPRPTGDLEVPEMDDAGATRSLTPSTTPSVGSDVEDHTLKPLWLRALLWCVGLVVLLGKAALKIWQEADSSKRKLIVVGAIGGISILINVAFFLRPTRTDVPAARGRVPAAIPTPRKRALSVSPRERLPVVARAPSRNAVASSRQKVPTPPLPRRRALQRPASEGASGLSGQPGIKWKEHLVEIKAGYFYQGVQEKQRGFGDAYPQRKVYLDTFWIDRYEVTTEQYLKCIRSGTCKRLMQWRFIGGNRDLSLKLSPKAPIAYVYWQEAVHFCRWAGKRLPTEAEWEKAARGTDKRKYPWGSQAPSCRLSQAAGCRHRDRVSLPKERAAGRSPYEIYDMSGSVWEWVQDCYSSKSYRELPLHNPVNDRRRCSKHVIRGGAFNTNQDHKLMVSYRTFGRRERNVGHGFRCAWSPRQAQTPSPSSSGQR